MKKMIDWVVKWWKSIVRVILIIIGIKILLPIPARPLFAFFLFAIVLELILQEMEENKAIKNALAKTFCFLGGVFIFLGLRIFMGGVLNMPLINSYNALDGIGIVGAAYKTVPPNLLIEIMFILPAIGVAYAFAKGGKAMRFFVWCLFCMMFFVCLWQVRQAQNYEAWQRNTQTNVDGKTKEWNLGALQKGVENRTIVAVAEEDFPSFTFVKKDSTFTHTGEIKCGDKMVLKDTNPKFNVGEAMIQVILEKDNLFTGDTVWVPYLKIKILESSPTSVSTSSESVKIYQPGTYTFSLKAGEQTGWIQQSPRVAGYGVSSSDNKFQLIFDDGQVVPAWEPGQWPKNKYKFKILAVEDQPKIEMVLK